MLDTQFKIETPEGIELGIRIAGPIVRGIAFLIDSIIKVLIYFALYLIIIFSYVSLGESGFNTVIGLLFIFIFFFEWFYSVLFEIFANGATPGKKIMGIKVVCDSGVPVNWSSSLTRNIVRVVDMFPFLYFFPTCGLGLLFILFGKRFKRIGDIAAGTVVVYSKDNISASRIKIVEANIPQQHLTLDEKKSIVMFSERHNVMTDSRAAELADILQVLTEETGKNGVNKLHSYASWVIGEK